MPRDVDSAVVTCPFKACGIDVRVLRADTRAPVDRAEVLLDERGETRTLGAVGTVSFERLPAGSYTARVTSATIGRELPAGLPRTGSTRVEAGARATIEILVGVQDWELTTVVISGAHESGGEGGADPPAPGDWEITEVVVKGAAEDDGAGGADEPAPGADWTLTTIEISGDSSDSGDGDEPAAAPPPNATWELSAIEIVDDAED